MLFLSCEYTYNKMDSANRSIPHKPDQTPIPKLSRLPTLPEKNVKTVSDPLQTN